MKLPVKQLGKDAQIYEIDVQGEALDVGLLLSIPLNAQFPDAPARTVRLLVTWAALRGAMPKAMQEFGPKMLAATRGA